MLHNYNAFIVIIDHEISLSVPDSPLASGDGYMAFCSVSLYRQREASVEDVRGRDT